MLSGASGFMSKLSCCDSPPERKIKMHDLALPLETTTFRCGGLAQSNQMIHAESKNPNRASLQRVAT